MKKIKIIQLDNRNVELCPYCLSSNWIAREYNEETETYPLFCNDCYSNFRR